jgi:SAM-dependent methyltransferase
VSAWLSVIVRGRSRFGRLAHVNIQAHVGVTHLSPELAGSRVATRRARQCALGSGNRSSSQRQVMCLEGVSECVVSMTQPSESLTGNSRQDRSPCQAPDRPRSEISHGQRWSTVSLMAAINGLLSRVWAYNSFQRFVGADRLRYRCIEQLDLSPGATVLDVGCGPAYYFPRLPSRVRYFGYDTDARYVEWAQKRWGNGDAIFRLGGFDEKQAASLPPIDAVLLLGILHHLSDEDSTDLLDLAARCLAPSGRVVTIDTCFEPSQGRISRWMAESDRGDYVREPSAFVELAESRFQGVEGELLIGLTRLPGSYWMMTMSDPRPIEPSK